MKIRIEFSNVSFRPADDTIIGVKVGETFTVILQDAPSSVNWFADYDQNMEITVGDHGQTAQVKALSEGPVEIQLQVNRKIEGRLNFQVFSSEAKGFDIPPPTTEPR